MMMVLVHIFFPEYIKDFCYEFASRPNLFFLFFLQILSLFFKEERGGEIQNLEDFQGRKVVAPEFELSSFLFLVLMCV